MNYAIRNGRTADATGREGKRPTEEAQASRDLDLLQARGTAAGHPPMPSGAAVKSLTAIGGTPRRRVFRNTAIDDPILLPS